MMFRLLPLSLLAALGCAARNPGAQPGDMGADAHEATAVAHDAEATAAAASYDPAATEGHRHCGGGKGDTPCWTSITNPTESFLREAERHREMAEAHRAASQALRDAEAIACVGLAAPDRDQSPFEAHSTDIARVEPFSVQRGGKVPDEHLLGAVITLRAVEGLTAEWLQRVVDCHVARNAAVGHAMPEMVDCPLVPAGARAEVASTGSGFAVTIRSDDGAAAADILARARRLVP